MDRALKSLNELNLQQEMKRKKKNVSTTEFGKKNLKGKTRSKDKGLSK